MDLELTDEQTMLGESLTTLLEREWLPAERRTPRRRASCGAAVDVGAAESSTRSSARSSCASRARRSARTWPPRRSSAAPRCATPAPSLLDAGESVAIALLEPGRGWSVDVVQAEWVDGALRGRKVAVEHADEVDRFAVVALVDGEPGVVLAPRGTIEPQPSLDATSRWPRRVRRRRGRRRPERRSPPRLARLSDRRAARRRGGRGRGRAHARRRARLRRRAPPVRPHDRLLPGAAPHPGRHVRAPRERLVDRALRRRRARRRRRPTPS